MNRVVSRTAGSSPTNTRDSPITITTNATARETPITFCAQTPTVTTGTFNDTPIGTDVEEGHDNKTEIVTVESIPEFPEV
eukprot:CAMPEP_0201573402 /NCGR_PEP_ID=MMETSP0190_2-20130828/17252_1 /ASSEMBLY_ACC=CAM_ASM_000263 /TAXON_ID=37353 /ORGANISM="Rosalina sp." /LENGTH=79 /DNA_ID=CAMNT_0048000349 /DNA_START=452 /DNA_END=687 /DNA_ORIENTATION=-